MTLNLPAVSVAPATVIVGCRDAVVTTGAAVAVTAEHRFAVATDHGDPLYAAAAWTSAAPSTLTAMVAAPPDVGIVSTRIRASVITAPDGIASPRRAMSPIAPPSVAKS